ncbi:DUF5993 family protein [Streptomyces sp. MST-110588]|uniref:DUF5993 family protein n=1 Tax=Streptomyces sp. MST-110588 TaxID=2833628 RepID=UPI001F5D4B04|nr:DUF5993 family protein [Streptomyces sp. MST-110588]UNO39843.1 hypothetical protein KGS77_09900 [Streptomyces sp. MST-110588]
MDTLVSSGLLVTMLAIVGRRGRTAVLGAWWATLAVAALLLAHHITSSLALGLNY